MQIVADPKLDEPGDERELRARLFRVVRSFGRNPVIAIVRRKNKRI